MYDASKANSYWEACKKSAIYSYNSSPEFEIGNNTNVMETNPLGNIADDLIEKGAWSVGGCVGGMVRYGLKKDQLRSESN